MNLQKIQAAMAQAQKIQRDLEKASNLIDKTTFKYENDNIEVECLGNNTVTKINVKNSDLLCDAEMLSDVMLVAINNVLEQIKNEKNDKLGKYTNGLGGLF